MHWAVGQIWVSSLLVYRMRGLNRPMILSFGSSPESEDADSMFVLVVMSDPHSELGRRGKRVMAKCPMWVGWGTVRASPREMDNWYLVPHSYVVDLQILDVTERTQE
jgi:hypothetical protein